MTDRFTSYAADVSRTAIDNTLMAARLDEFAALLELAGARSYSVRAYVRAAELVRAAPVPVADLVRAGRVRELKGVGPSIERRLRELTETGEIVEMVELRRSTPLELAALGRLLGLGAKRATEIGAALGITTVDYALHTARRGRAGPADVVNTQPLAELLANEPTT
jgi:DNA polymerase (family X)